MTSISSHDEIESVSCKRVSAHYSDNFLALTSS